MKQKNHTEIHGVVQRYTEKTKNLNHIDQLQLWEKSIEFTHTQTSFPESLLLNELGRSPGLRLVVDLPIWIWD